MVEIKGNTYPVKDQLKAMGARWNADKKAWVISADKAEAARKLVSGDSNEAAKRAKIRSMLAARGYTSKGRWIAGNGGYPDAFTRDLDSDLD
jgi:hypothetical protein